MSPKMTSNEFKLSQEMIKLSVADKWSDAKLEWKLDFILKIEDEETCLCSHTPIKELCYMKNIKNNNTAIIGNVCVTKFIGIDSERIFLSIRNIYINRDKAINEDLALYAKDKNLINEWEYNFSISTLSKRARSLTDKQLEKRIIINNKLIDAIKAKR